jgi:hypothetical protein
MTLNHRWAWIALLASSGLWSFGGCSSENTDQTDSGASSGGSGDGSVGCTDDPRALTYAANLARNGSTFTVVLVSADPAPPAKGNNTWHVKVLDANGAQVPDAALTIDPDYGVYMPPPHGHASPIKPSITAETDGSYTVTPLYFFMPGLWAVTFTVAQGTTTDQIPFSFCIQG